MHSTTHDSPASESLVVSVNKIALSIMDIVAGYEDRNSLTIHIFNICLQIQTAIAPLLGRQSLDLNNNVQQCLRALIPALDSTQKHLEMWIVRRAHNLVSGFNPWLLAHRLKENKKHLLQHYITLMTALQVVDRIRGYNFVSPAASMLSFQNQEVRHRPKQRPPPKDIFTDLFPESEAKEFWRNNFEDEPSSVDSSIFLEALSNWLGRTIDDAAYHRLLLRLDFDNDSTIHFSTFYDLVRNGKMKDIINSYLADPRLPLLIWIDEDVRGNTDRVFEATSYGVTVVQLASIPSAKTWIATNHEFLTQNDDPSNIRFIISQACIDSYFESFDVPEDTFENGKSGSMLRYIRNEGFASAILIYSPEKTIESTTYVEDDQLHMAGSTTPASSVYKEYVAALGERRNDDSGWRKYNAT